MKIVNVTKAGWSTSPLVKTNAQTTQNNKRGEGRRVWWGTGASSNNSSHVSELPELLFTNPGPAWILSQNL